MNWTRIKEFIEKKYVEYHGLEECRAMEYGSEGYIECRSMTLNCPYAKSYLQGSRCTHSLRKLLAKRYQKSRDSTTP